MPGSVLIANRGEIACRVIRTARRLGIRTIAVYCHEDRKARHVRMADEAHEIDGDSPAAAYLDAGAIVEAAKTSGAESVHPGYGFLSENAGFAAAVAAAGLTFIGPSTEVIQLMGDKIRSRAFAARAGVPVAPSFTDEGDIAAFVAGAAGIGFPLLVKATAGGGGKGMSIVRTAAEFADRAVTAAAEAERYFGNGRIYAERYIERPRHIEVQVFGDRHGNVVHLGERECSIQRRFQKIIEEAPAPNLEPALRAGMCQAAVDLARAAGYANAGTVEFILAPDGTFYFLEMNTRLQVEHPVTELVTGLDLVELQFRIADGEPLPLSQPDVQTSGHAIEMRICAEQPENDFLPVTGTLSVLAEPSGPGVRFDAGLRAGMAVTASFDPMLAKLIVHAPTRTEAAGRAVQALAETALLGIETNLDYLARVVAHPAFLSGRLHTGFLTEHAAELAPGEPDDDLCRALAAAAALGVPDFRRAAFEVPAPYADIGFWRN